ncbi:MAG: NAD-dependent epimerase/dehydratase family protein [Euryarchaeota archaeon]|nr:NAD-dependent epimerase/dehydratase family protein [Euryarchaeota archaeon]
MRVLVTGATGFIGRNMVQYLRDLDHDVVGLARATSKEWKVHALQAMGADVAFGDVVDRSSVAAAVKDCDAVVHTAALVRLGRVDPDEMERTNVGGTENVLAAARDAKVDRVLHVSSIAALGLHANGMADETSDHSGAYTSPYERTKHVSTLVADQYSDSGLRIVQAFPSVVFGRRDPNFGHYLKRYMQRKIPVLPAPDTSVPLVHVEDLARGLHLALTKGKRGDRFVFNQADILLGDLFARLEAITGIPQPRLVISAKAAKRAIKVASAMTRVLPGVATLPATAGDFLGKKRTYSSKAAIDRLGWDPGDFDARLEDTARYYAERYGKDRNGA